MPAKTGLLFTLRLIPVIGTMLARRGISAEPILSGCGVPLDAMRGEITAPLKRVQAFMIRAAEALGTDLFGLELAEAMPSGTYGVAEFLMRSAPTLDAALHTLCEFSSLINPIANMRMIGAEFHYAVASERDMLGEHLNEFSISYIVRQFKAIQGSAMPLESVWFAHERRTSGDDVARRFGCPARFHATDCGFSVTRDVLATEMRTADPLLYQFLLQQARAQLARAGEVDIVTHLVRVLETRLAHGRLGTTEVARAMAMTPRTLQRQLADAGTSFRAVLAHVRMRRRAELLEAGLGDAAIARHLGFSDVRAMRRSIEE